MSDPRYSVRAVHGRQGDSLVGKFLGNTDTLVDAFTLVGQAIDTDNNGLQYVIYEQDGNRSWIVLESV